MSNVPHDKFFTDPEWHLVAELIEGFIEPLLNMDSIDITQPAEHVKAEIIGRRLAYKSLRDFLEQSKLIATKVRKVDNSNPFK